MLVEVGPEIEQFVFQRNQRRNNNSPGTALHLHLEAVEKSVTAVVVYSAKTSYNSNDALVQPVFVM